MFLRSYQTTDRDETAHLFYETVHTINRKDYSVEQVDAWAKKTMNLQAWDASFLKNFSIVAVEHNQILGFGDIDDTGHLNRLYIQKDHQGQGIASAICDALERSVSQPIISVDASITARPFFTQRGYQLIQEQRIIRDGIALTNYKMIKRK